MEFFGMTRTEFSTPVGQAIDKATSDLLLGPDWAVNMEICDMINQSPEQSQNAIKAFRRKLRSDNPKVIMLTLTLVETCVKNCNLHFHSMVGSREVLGDVVALTDGKKGWDVREQSLSLLQQWGLAFQAKQDVLPYFYETYMKLRLKGVQFPPAEESSPIFTPPAHSFTFQSPGQTPEASRDAASAGSDHAGSAEAELNKLKEDLMVVRERVKLCREMLPNSPGVREDEALAEVVGFLEACKPRMVDLVEAGMQGLLTEELLELSLKVNDELLKTLEAERTGVPIAVKDVDDATAGAGGATQDLIDFGDSKPSAASQVPSSSSLDPFLDMSGEETGGSSLSLHRKGRSTGGASAAPQAPLPLSPPRQAKPPSAPLGNPFDPLAGGASSASPATAASLGFDGLHISSPGLASAPGSSSNRPARDPLVNLDVADDFDKFLSERISSPNKK